MYAKFGKRIIDFLLSLSAIIILTPLIIILIILGAIFMGGNPFFVQKRPGKDEKIFNLVKFRTMDNRKDPAGNLLPDEVRLNRYGRFLRSTSLDEIPEIFNILLGHMSFIGPRPLLVVYLPWYSEEQKRRHNVRPGLTGYAQANGRNSVDWDERFKMDLEYVENITLCNDLKILFDTVFIVLKREGISSATSETMDSFIDYCKSRGRKPRY